MPAKASRVIAGRYQLLRLLSRDDLGSLHAAYDLSSDRQVIVRPSPGAAPAPGADLFDLAASASGGLAHPAAARVLDAQPGPDGYIVWEMPQGPSFQQVISDHAPLSPDLAASAAMQMAEALASAHREGRAHPKLTSRLAGYDLAGQLQIAGLSASTPSRLEAWARQNLRACVEAACVAACGFVPSDAGQIPAAVPRPLARVLAAGLNGRLASCAQLAKALEPLVPERGRTARLASARGPWPRRAAWAAAAAACLAAGAGAGYLVSGEPGKAVTVPSVLGRTSAQAAARLRAAGLRPVISVAPARLGVRPGLVIREAPAGGSKARKGSRAKLTVSGAAVVPDVAGSTAGAAVRRLRAAGIRASVTFVPTGRALPGTVLKVSPPAGSRATAGTARLVAAAAPVSVAVPDLVGLAEGQAAAALRRASLKGSVSRRASPKPAGTVISQAPGAGQQALAGAAVRYEASSGPAAAPAAQARVPDLLGMTLAAGSQALLRAGLQMKVAAAATGRPVISGQDPAAGSLAPAGSAVSVTAGR